MSTIVNLTDPKWWIDDTAQTESDVSDARFGYTSINQYYGKALVTRLSFKVPITGASHYKIDIKRCGRRDVPSSATKKQVSYLIGRNPNQCIGWHGENVDRTGDFTISLEDDLNRLRAEGDFNMLPGETLYLWLYHGGTKSSYGIYRFAQVAQEHRIIELSGIGGGIARVQVEGEEQFATPFIWTNGEWQSSVPYINNDGEFKTTC